MCAAHTLMQHTLTHRLSPELFSLSINTTLQVVLQYHLCSLQTTKRWHRKRQGQQQAWTPVLLSLGVKPAVLYLTRWTILWITETSSALLAWVSGHFGVWVCQVFFFCVRVLQFPRSLVFCTSRLLRVWSFFPFVCCVNLKLKTAKHLNGFVCV